MLTDIDVIEHRADVFEVIEQLKFTLGRVGAKWLQRGFGDDPRGNRSGGGFGLEGPSGWYSQA